jgi:hypothetical protein
VPITTKVVSSNPDHARCSRYQHYVIKFVSDLRQVGGFLGYSVFLDQYNYIAESGANHHNPNLHLAWSGFELTTLVVIGTDCMGNYKSNFHTITTTTVSSISYSIYDK